MTAWSPWAATPPITSSRTPHPCCMRPKKPTSTPPNAFTWATTSATSSRARRRAWQLWLPLMVTVGPKPLPSAAGKPTPSLTRPQTSGPPCNSGPKNLRQLLLQTTYYRQHEKRKHCADHGSGFTTIAHRHANGSGHPDTGRCRQPLHLPFFIALQDGARPQKADARHYTLNDAANVGALHATGNGHQGEQRRAQRHQHMRAQTGILSPAFTLVTNCGAQDNGQPKPQNNDGSALDIRNI